MSISQLQILRSSLETLALFFRIFLSIKVSSLLIMLFFCTDGLYYSFLSINDTIISIRSFYPKH